MDTQVKLNSELVSIRKLHAEEVVTTLASLTAEVKELRRNGCCCAVNNLLTRSSSDPQVHGTSLPKMLSI